VFAFILSAALMLGSSSNASVVPSANFAGQARAAHLSASQQVSLQSEVNHIMARYGGRQVALNEIALPHGASVLFPLPGQRVAHVLPGAPRLSVSKTKAADTPAWAVGQTWYAADGASCPYYYLCTWQGQSWTGIQFNVSQCNIWQEFPGSGWNSYGSWANNQTPDTSGYLANASQQQIAEVAGSNPDTGPSWGG
jgi:hypothetical protein